MPIDERVYIVCKHCNSDDIEGNSRSTWNFYEQMWETWDIGDEFYCNDCDSITTIKELYLQIEDEE
jgi:hypothetical protein